MANAVVLWVIVYFCVTSVNTKDRSLGVCNIRILTARGWHVPTWLGLFLSRRLGVEDHLTLYYFSDL